MISEDKVKEYLAIYEDEWSYKKFEKVTGLDYDTLRYIYYDMQESGETKKIKEDVFGLSSLGGIYQIHPVTFSSVHYMSLKEIRDAGYISSNVTVACQKKTSLCSGYLWRYGVDIDAKNIEKSLKEENPKLFIPVRSIDIKTGEYNNYSSIQLAHVFGFSWYNILEVLNAKKPYKGCYWESM